MKHLEEQGETGETYFQHMRHAMGIAFLLVSTGAKCFIHGLVPSLFVCCVSSRLTEISAKVNRNETPT
jgi:hypothetical protein